MVTVLILNYTESILEHFIQHTSMSALSLYVPPCMCISIFNCAYLLSEYNTYVSRASNHLHFHQWASVPPSVRDNA